MPIYSITDPDGKEWEIEGPAGATKEQVITAVQNSQGYKTHRRTTGEQEALKFQKDIPEYNTEKLKPTLSAVFSAGKAATKKALESSYNELKNSNLSSADKANARATEIISESKGPLSPDINYEDLPLHKKLAYIAPGAGTILGSALAGGLMGGPPGAAVGGIGTAMAIASGGGNLERASLEKQGVDPQVAKNIGLLEGIVKPAAQIGTAALSPIGAAAAVPTITEGVNRLKNEMLQGQIQGPRTLFNPIEPYKRSMDDALIDTALGFAGGRRQSGPAEFPSAGPMKDITPEMLALPGPRKALPAPRPPEAPTAPSGTSPVVPPSPPSGGGGGVSPRQRGSVITATKEPLFAIKDRVSKLLDEAYKVDTGTQLATLTKQKTSSVNKPTSSLELPLTKAENPLKPTSSSPPEIPGYTESLGTSSPTVDRAELPGYVESLGSAPIDARSGITSDIRQAIASRKPVQTAPPTERVQEMPGLSRQQVEEQQAVAKKLTYAGYQETSPGVWTHKEAVTNYEKKAKDLPETGGPSLQTYEKAAETKKRQKINEKLDPLSGKALTNDFYKSEEADLLDRVWALDQGNYVPWDGEKTAAKINPKATFVIGQPYLDLAKGTTPKQVAMLLGEHLPWFDIGDKFPTTWEEFKNQYGGTFFDNGYDAMAFTSKDGGVPNLIVFDPRLVEDVSSTTAKSLSALKTLEYVQQLKDALWTKIDRTPEQIRQDWKNIQSAIEREASTSDILTYLEAGAPSKAMRSLAKSMNVALEQQAEIGITTHIGLAEADSDIPYAGYYSYSEDANKITLYVNKDGLTFRTLLHEIIHAVTIPVLPLVKTAINSNDVPTAIVQKYQNLRKASEEFFAHLQRSIGQLEFDADNEPHNKRLKELLYNKSAWTENVHEALAYALTEPSFQRLLHSIPIKEDNGLWWTTEAVREFHGIEDNMNSLFYEAVKLFNEFANFDLSMVPGIQDATTTSIVSVYHARPVIRGPPDIDQAIMNYLNDHATAQIMAAGSIPMPFSVGATKLKSLNRPLHPLMNGQEIYNAAPTSPTTTNFADAPVYMAEFTAQEMAAITTHKSGISANGKFYFLVDNTDYPPLILSMRRSLPDSFLDREEFMYMVTNKIAIQKAIFPHLEEDRVRALIEYLPNAVRPTKKQQKQIEASSPYLDLGIDEALALWRQSTNKDIPKSYEVVWNQLVSGAELAATLTNHPLIRYARGQISKAIGEQAKVSSQIIAPLGEKYSALPDKDRVTMMMTLLSFDRLESKLTVAEMQQRGFSQDMMDFVEAYREADDYLYDLWNEKRKKLGFPPIPYRTGHVASTFSGDYRALAKDNNGEILGVITAWTKSGFEAVIKEVKQKFNADITVLPKKKMEAMPLSGNLFDIYMEITKALGPNNPTIQNLQSVLQEFAKFDENRYLGFHVHELAKKGVWGAEGDKFWKTDLDNANDLFQASIKYFQEGVAHHNMLEFMQDMDRIFLDADINTRAPRTVLYLRELYNHVLRHNPVTQGEYSKSAQILKNIGKAGDTLLDVAMTASDLATVPGTRLSAGVGPQALLQASGTVRYAFATFAMGLGNIAFSIIQLLQLPIFAAPQAMIARHDLGLKFLEGRDSAMKAAFTLSNYLAHHISGGKSTQAFGKMSQEEEIALKYAEDNNLINFTDIERTMEHVLSPTLSKADRILNFNQRYAEVLTRPVAFLWFFNLARASGMPMKEALESSRHRTQTAMVPYDLRDRPMAYASLGFFGQALGQLKTFTHASTSAVWINMKRMKTHKQMGPAVYGTAAALLLQGQMGLIGMQDVDNLVRAFNVKFNNENKGIKEIAYSELPKWYSKGIMTEWTGVDFYSRLRSPAILQWPMVNSVIPPAYNWLGGIIGDVSQLTKLKDIQPDKIKGSQEYQQSMLGLTPPPFKGILEKEYGNKSYNKFAAPLTGYERDTFDQNLRYFGLRSAKEADWMEKYYDTKSDSVVKGMSNADTKKKLIEAYKKGYYKQEYINQLIARYIETGGHPKDLIYMMKSYDPELTSSELLGKPSPANAARIKLRDDIMKQRDKQ